MPAGLLKSGLNAVIVCSRGAPIKLMQSDAFVCIIDFLVVSCGCHVFVSRIYLLIIDVSAWLQRAAADAIPGQPAAALECDD